MNANRAALMAWFFLCGSMAVSQGAERSYRGSTPANEPILKALDVSTKPPELIQWQLTLVRDDRTGEPVRYRLRTKYGNTTPNRPGLGDSGKVVERSGNCRVLPETKAKGSDATGEIYELGPISVAAVGPNLLHLVNADGSLMVGDGGWSYTLNATDAEEKVVDPVLAATVPDMSYRIEPLATGQNVFAVFEGRTPALGIAQQLKIPVPPSATKAKWRVTLYQDTNTHEPTTFKVEGTLFRPAKRGGKWAIMRAKDGGSTRTTYELKFADADLSIRLLAGDANVLFFLGDDGKPLVGNGDFSYTLNRKTGPAVISQAPAR